MAGKIDYLPSRFETLVEAKERREKLIRCLLAEGTSASLDLGDRLKACERNARCWSDACAVCKRIWRLRLLRQTADLLGNEPSLLRVSIIPRGGLIVAASCSTSTCRNTLRVVRGRFSANWIKA